MNKCGTLCALLAVSVALAGVGNALAEKPAKETRTITGVVKKYESSGDRVLSVYISDPENGDFLVIRSTEIGKALRKQVGAKISATGYVKKSRSEPEFEFVLDPLEYEILTPAPEKKGK